MAVVFLLVAIGLAWLLNTMMARPGGERPNVLARGLLAPELGELGPTGEKAPDPPPDLRETTEKLAKISRENWGGAEIYAPRGEEIDPVTGEATLPFYGFGVSVDTVPEGAKVFVDGREIGESPAVASVDCKPDSEVRIRIEKASFQPLEQTTRCRTDRILQLKIKLRR